MFHIILVVLTPCVSLLNFCLRKFLFQRHVNSHFFPFSSLVCEKVYESGKSSLHSINSSEITLPVFFSLTFHFDCNLFLDFSHERFGKMYFIMLSLCNRYVPQEHQF